jgi:DNA-binding transcriptional regulator LsrR (DeoR family)
MAKVQKALERVRAADAAAIKAREDFRRTARKEVDEGRLTKSGIARELGISRQRVQELLQDR